MSFLDGAERKLGQVSNLIAVVCVSGMLAIAGVIMIDVLLRWLANAPIRALNEIVAMVFAVAISACIPAGLARRVNLKVDIVSRWLSPRAEAWCELVGGIFLLAFFGILAWQITDHANFLMRESRTSVILRVPEAPFMYVVGALLAFGALVQTVMIARQARDALALEFGGSGEQGRALRLAGWAAVAVCIAAIAWGIHEFDALSAWANEDVLLTVSAAFAVMWLLTIALVPLAPVMGIAGVVCTALFIGWGPSLNVAATEAAGFLNHSQLATLPLFLMMGSFTATADIAEDVYRLAHVVLGRLRGGLALATIGGCAAFGSLTGSSMATAMVIGRVSIPEMRAHGYSPALATGCGAAGGSLGALIPPSGPLVLFALLAEASIGQLFIGAILPGVIAVAFYFLTIMLYVRISPGSAAVRTESVSGEVWPALRRCGPAVLLFFSVLGGIYLGVFTAVEAAAIGAFEAFLCAIWRGKLRGGAFWKVMAETTGTTALIYGLIFGAQIFSFFIAQSGLTEAATATVAGLDWKPVEIIALILVVYLVLGTMMEAFAVLVITVPIVTPLILELGYDIIWWGVINLVIVEIGLIHPPLGLNVFVVKSMQPDVPIGTIYKGVFPFVIADLVKLVLLVAFPALVLWLGSTMSR